MCLNFRVLSGPLACALLFLVVSCSAPNRRGYDRTRGGYAPSTPRGVSTQPARRTQTLSSTAASSTATSPAGTVSQRDGLDAHLRAWLGTPYRFGGATKGGVDCSGLVYSVFRDWKGITIPRNTRDSFKTGKSVARNALRRGDVVFFGSRWGVNHNGIYLGNGNFFHASSSQGVVITPLSDPYWNKRYRGARRFI